MELTDCVECTKVVNKVSELERDADEHTYVSSFLRLWAVFKAT